MSVEGVNGKRDGLRQDLVKGVRGHTFVVVNRQGSPLVSHQVR